MNETTQIVVMVLTYLLVVGALLYFTRRKRKRQFYLLLPIILAGTVWLGFAHGWRTSDFVRLALIVAWAIVACFFIFRRPEQE